MGWTAEHGQKGSRGVRLYSQDKVRNPVAVAAGDSVSWAGDAMKSVEESSEAGPGVSGGLRREARERIADGLTNGPAGQSAHVH